MRYGYLKPSRQPYEQLAEAPAADPPACWLLTDGAYVRRWVPELTDLLDRARVDYPEPIVDLAEGLERFRRARGTQ